MTNPKNWGQKLINLLAAFLLVASCATSIIRPTEEGRHIPLIGGRALAPGAPWGFVDYGYGHFTLLTTGDYEGLIKKGWAFGPEGIGHPPASVLTVVPYGRIGVGPWTGNEMIFVNSNLAEPMKLSAAEFIEKTKAEVKKKISPPATDIRDISNEYEERLKFWGGYMFAFAYKAWGRDYRVVDAFALVPGPKPDSHVLHDFSYFRMETGAKDHFDDFAAMLRSVHLPAQPPEGIFKTYVGFPPRGTKWVARITDSIHGAQTTTLTALGDIGRYKGRQVYRIRIEPSTEGEVLIYDEATANLITILSGTILSGQKETMLSFPHEGTFSWPLWVGKSWIARYTYYDRAEKLPIETHWTVEAYEDVQVPAGTWKAFRLRGSSPVTTSTIWYAPEINLVVKRMFERTPDHPRGYYKVVNEVIEYPAK